jgi:hypothetical protein
MCVISVLWSGGGWYYLLLRWVVFSSSLVIVRYEYAHLEKEHPRATYLSAAMNNFLNLNRGYAELFFVGFICIGVLFNPIWQFHLHHGQWQVIDVVAGISFVVAFSSYSRDLDDERWNDERWRDLLDKRLKRERLYARQLKQWNKKLSKKE